MLMRIRNVSSSSLDSGRSVIMTGFFLTFLSFTSHFAYMYFPTCYSSYQWTRKWTFGFHRR